MTLLKSGVVLIRLLFVKIIIIIISLFGVTGIYSVNNHFLNDDDFMGETDIVCNDKEKFNTKSKLTKLPNCSIIILLHINEENT